MQAFTNIFTNYFKKSFFLANYVSKKWTCFFKSNLFEKSHKKNDKVVIKQQNNPFKIYKYKTKNGEKRKNGKKPSLLLF